MTITSLRAPSLHEDSFTLLHHAAVRQEEFQKFHSAVYGDFKPGENAANKLCRAIRWGAYTEGISDQPDDPCDQYRDEIKWLDRRDYSLTADENEEEGGRVRRFGLLSLEYLRRPEVKTMIRKTYEALGFAETPRNRIFEVQLSAVRYEPSLTLPALPSPVAAHHDRIDGAIWVVAKTDFLHGGRTRIYTPDETPLYELDLDVGEAIVLRDSKVKHSVSPILLVPGAGWRPGVRAFRDILIVRFQAVGR